MGDSVLLNHRLYTAEDTSKPTLVILHGLFGSGKNWISIAKALTTKNIISKVYLLDQRNHGESPHTKSHSLHLMALDVLAWLDQFNIQDVFIMGHSMGGLVASLVVSRVADRDRFNGLVLIDIFPRWPCFDYSAELKALSLPLDGIKDRRAISRALADIISEEYKRDFLMMNLARQTDGFIWKINTTALKEYISSCSDSKEGKESPQDYFSHPGEIFPGPTLVVKGQMSPFINQQDELRFKERFPNGILERIQGAGHWLHASHSDQLITIMASFYLEILKKR